MTTSHKETAKSAQEQSSYPNFYSDETIREMSDNLEKQAKIFFNCKLCKIITDGSLRDWGIQAIHGVIDVHWVLRKNNILIS